MKYDGAVLRLKASEYAVMMDSGYDSFPKKTEVYIPDGWVAIIVQNGEFISSRENCFVVKELKEDGLKVPLFGDVSMTLWFARKHFKNSNLRTEPKEIDCKGGKHKLTCDFKYEVELVTPRQLAQFVLSLKLKANSDGLMLGFGDINYVTDVVIGNYVEPGYKDPPAPRRPGSRLVMTDEEFMFQLKVSMAYEKHVFPGIGYRCDEIKINSFRID